MLEQGVKEKQDLEFADGILEWKLRRAPKENWSKIQQYDYTEFKLGPLVNGRTGRPDTGLTNKDAERLAKALGRAENELYDHMPFWQDFFIGIGSGVTRLDLSRPEDELLFRFLKNHKFVAFGYEQLRVKSKALFVLYNDVDEAKTYNKGRNAKKLAYARFNEMDSKEMIDVLMVMGERVLSTDPSIVEAQMDRLVEKRPGDFIDILSDEDFKMKLFITKCLHFDVLQRGKGTNIDDMRMSFNGEILGEGLADVVDKLKKTANQPVLLALQKRIEVAQGAGTLAGAPIMTGQQIEDKLVQQPKVKNSEKHISSNAAHGTIKPQVAGKGENVKDEGRVDEILGGGNSSVEFDETDV
jgi:hypothetical protein